MVLTTVSGGAGSAGGATLTLDRFSDGTWRSATRVLIRLRTGLGNGDSYYPHYNDDLMAQVSFNIQCTESLLTSSLTCKATDWQASAWKSFAQMNSASGMGAADVTVTGRFR